MGRKIPERECHVIKEVVTRSNPSNLLFFDTETKAQYKDGDDTTQYHYLWFGYAIGFRYENNEVTRYYERRFDTIDGFYSILYKRMDRKRPLYVFAHNLAFDLTIVDFWQQLEAIGATINFAIMESPPLCISITLNGCRIIFVNTFNYWQTTLAKMGESIGHLKLPMPSMDASKEEWDKYCKQDVVVLAEMVKGLFRFIVDNDLGTFGISGPSFAMNTYKYRFMKHQIYVHDRVRVLQLERNAYYGGLVTNYYVGKVESGPVYCLDVNSLYPTVMRNPLPTKLINSVNNPTIKDVESRMKQYGCIATVSINSKVATYPKRYQGRLCDVNGRFLTSLCGPELQRAISSGHVTHIHCAAFYEMAPIFKTYVEYFWSLRKAFKEAKQTVYEQFCKLLLNSLYGKFGQRGFQWRELSPGSITDYYDLFGVQAPDEYTRDGFQPILGWGNHKWFAKGLPEAITIRYMHGHMQIKFPIGEHYESSPAIAAFVTSFAREELRRIIKLCGPNQVYYCDTDSVFVTERGRRMLESFGCINPRELGKLKLEGSSNNAEFYGPKDYIFGDKIVMKGVRKNAKKIGPNEYEQDQFEGIKSVLNRKPEPYITIKRVRKKLSRKYTKGIVSKRGWVEPFRLNDPTE